MGKTIKGISISGSDRRVINVIHVSTVVDRTMLSLLAYVPYGTAARIVSILKNLGHLASTGKKRHYRRASLDLNSDFDNIPWFNYNQNPDAVGASSERLKKTPTFDAWMKAYTDRVRRAGIKAPLLHEGLSRYPVPADLPALIELVATFQSDDDETHARNVQMVRWLEAQIPNEPPDIPSFL